MSYDPQSFDEDDLEGQSMDRNRRFKDFDCPACNANNPYDDSFGDGDEVLCYYCGQEYKVAVSVDGKLRLKES